MTGIEKFTKETGVALGRLPDLQQRYPEAKEVLGFYGRVLECQLAIAEGIGIADGKVDGIAWGDHVDHLRGFLDLCAEAPTAEVASGAVALRGADDARLVAIVGDFLREKQAEPVERFILAGFLGGALVPVESLGGYDRRQWLKGICPVCGFPPVVSYLADMDESEGGRFARCGICHADWYLNRGNCISCGNADDEKLHYYLPEKIPSTITVQACSECGGYIKMVEGRGAVQVAPELDDVASMTLDLWVREKGFSKISPNLFGM